jgi:xylan 1,4-beta-xylosidase
MVARAAKKVYDQVKTSAAPNTPIIWSEYNATYMNQQEVTDSAFMGPWLANNIRECDGLVTIMAYWCFSDVFDEQGVVKTPFYGGYGVVAERNIPKAAFRDFELLHTLGDRRLPVDSEDALATKRADGRLVIALWNYAEPGENAASKTFNLSIKGARAKKYRMRFVSPGNGSSLEAWNKMGSPQLPSLSQIKELIAASALPAAQTAPINRPIVLGPQTLAVVEIER